MKRHLFVHVKELDIFLTMKVFENTPAVLSLGKLCDENGYSYEWINGQNTHLIKDGIRIISFLSWFQACQVRPLDLHQLQRHLRDKRVIPHHLLQPRLLTVSEIQTREREDRIDSNFFPVQVSNSVGDGSGQPDETQANKNPKPNEK